MYLSLVIPWGTLDKYRFAWGLFGRFEHLHVHLVYFSLEEGEMMELLLGFQNLCDDSKNGCEGDYSRRGICLFYVST